MKFLVLLLPLFVANISFANTTFPQSICDESVATDIIKFLQKEEPTSSLQVVKDSNGEVTGLVDASGVYPAIEFIHTMELEIENNYENVFQYGTTFVYADFILFYLHQTACRHVM